MTIRVDDVDEVPAFKGGVGGAREVERLSESQVVRQDAVSGSLALSRRVELTHRDTLDGLAERGLHEWAVRHRAQRPEVGRRARVRVNRVPDRRDTTRVRGGTSHDDHTVANVVPGDTTLSGH